MLAVDWILGEAAVRGDIHILGEEAAMESELFLPQSCAAPLTLGMSTFTHVLKCDILVGDMVSEVRE